MESNTISQLVLVAAQVIISDSINLDLIMEWFINLFVHNVAYGPHNEASGHYNGCPDLRVAQLYLPFGGTRVVYTCDLKQGVYIPTTGT